MKAQIKKLFTMVEVALAIGIIGIGIAGIMVLFPIGFNSIRDAMAESYSADASEEFMTYISRYCKNNWAATLWTAVDTDPGMIDSDTPPYQGDTGVTSDIDKDDTGGNANIDWCDDSEAIDGCIYFNDLVNNGSPDDLKCFKIVRKTGSAVDFEAAMRLWKKPITNLNIAGQTIDFSDPSLASSKYKYGAALYVEISWPYGIPYAKREKRYYHKEIFKPQ